MKSKTTALILSIFTGGLGIDRFYLGYIGMGVLKLITGGCFGILYIIDIINIATGRLAPADGSEYIDDEVSAPSSSIYDDLEKVATLYKSGAISDKEYAKMKANIMSKL